jgi:hypothetical protein
MMGETGSMLFSTTGGKVKLLTQGLRGCFVVSIISSGGVVAAHIPHGIGSVVKGVFTQSVTSEQQVEIQMPHMLQTYHSVQAALPGARAIILAHTYVVWATLTAIKNHLATLGVPVTVQIYSDANLVPDFGVCFVDRNVRPPVITLEGYGIHY